MTMTDTPDDLPSTRLGRLHHWIAAEIRKHTDVNVLDHVTPNMQPPAVAVAPGQRWGDMSEASVCRSLKEALIRMDVIIFAPAGDLFAAYEWIEGRLEEIHDAVRAAPNLDGHVSRFAIDTWNGPATVKIGNKTPAVACRVELKPLQIRKEETS